MKRIGSLVGVLALLVGFGWALNDTQAQDKDNPSIKEIMTKAHKGGNALLGKMAKELNSSDVPWDQVTTQSKALVRLGKALAKNTPPKGEKASWEEQTSKYNKNAQALVEAVDKKDKDAATTALKALQGSCKACHSNHKG